MLVKELIEALKEQPQDMEVYIDWDDGYSTMEIKEVIIANKFYEESCEKVVVLK